VLNASALKDAYLVAGLSEDQIAQIAAIATVRTYNSGQALTRIGDDCLEVFIILSGNVKVTSHDGDLLGEAGANSVVGEMGLVDGLPANAHVTCAGPVSVAAINIPELRRLANQNRDWGFVMLANLCRVMAARLRQTNARIDELCDLTTESWEHAL
jgi:CRP-like cAMP-binding protein